MADLIVHQGAKILDHAAWVAYQTKRFQLQHRAVRQYGRLFARAVTKAVNHESYTGTTFFLITCDTLKTFRGTVCSFIMSNQCHCISLRNGWMYTFLDETEPTSYPCHRTYVTFCTALAALYLFFPHFTTRSRFLSRFAIHFRSQLENGYRRTRRISMAWYRT